MVDKWQPGRLYFPGDLVRPAGSGDVEAGGLENLDFQSGDTGWTFDEDKGAAEISENGNAFTGTWSALVQDDGGGSPMTMVNDGRAATKAGEPVKLTVYVKCLQTPDDTSARAVIHWFNADEQELAPTYSFTEPTGFLRGTQASGVWVPITVVGVAPAEAVSYSVGAEFYWFPDGQWAVGKFVVDAATQAEPLPLIFRATQAAAGYSGSSEPAWPDEVSETVVDNEVTWTAVANNFIVWEAHRILVSGSVEPTWPTGIPGASVPDGTVNWELDSRRVVDENLPSSKIALLGASKIFAADDDIIRFSATVNALDWTTRENAGFLAFGLQQYGGNPVTALGLYRGNLAAFNTQGCQIWQIDEDPAAMTVLDAIPVPCRWPKTVFPVGDDLALLADVGIRSLALAGSSVNLKGGHFGQQVDPLAKTLLAAAVADELEPRGLYWPAQGQYWCVFGSEALVLTINGSSKDQRSWSRYTFPSAIDAWTILGEDLYLRSGTKVWRVDSAALYDDVHEVDLGVVVASVDVAVVEIGSGSDNYGRTGISLEHGEFRITSIISNSSSGVLRAQTVGEVPDDIDILRLYTSTGEFVDFDIQNPDSFPSSTLTWNSGAPWSADDIGETYQAQLVSSWTARLEVEVTCGMPAPPPGVTTVGYSAIDGFGSVEPADPELEDLPIVAIFCDEFEDGPFFCVRFADSVDPGDITAMLDALDDVNGKVRIEHWEGTLVLNVSAYTVDPEETGDTRLIGWNTQALSEDAPPWIPDDLNEQRSVIFSADAEPELVGEDFVGVIQWPHLEFGEAGADIELLAFDLVIKGIATISIGWDQRFQDYASDGPWTTPYEVDGDTLPKDKIPLEVSGPSLALRLEFAAGQSWEWLASNLYVKDTRKR